MSRKEFPTPSEEGDNGEMLEDGQIADKSVNNNATVSRVVRQRSISA